MEKFDFRGSTFAETESFITGLGEKRFRTKQIRYWIFDKCVDSFNSMTNISKSFRQVIGKLGHICLLTEMDKKVSSDGTIKYLFKLEDGHSIECVWIPEVNRKTLCISTQVGCKLGCTFCLTGKSGFKRNLTAAELVSQILMAKRLVPDGRITNLVLMGMGEPFDNMESTLQALRIITDNDFKLFGTRKITVSTAGVVPGIKLLSKEFPSINLAISITTANSQIRNRIMPINKKYSLARLRKALLEFASTTGRKTTFEYVMLAGVNDSTADAKLLYEYVQGIPCTINLIPFNDARELDFSAPSDNVVNQFQSFLMGKGLLVFIRKSRGQDIRAACGLLRESKNYT
ncbi:MAG TPA: 23S rRNA (adenine(2503)-C(2))-methyltransferase RlmN [Nitrospinota bacterium]|jgi:23S rRNA (adenine2503-C2)-methyltransferase|nr:23S rRNA (adenine(2503)-C(2))-methyltransferase RlmN [Nitrospinota bacterium]|tara:strand:- start:21431 stop:22465 length:1035 start_codon:yes stop_codon:yes gene_type:complete